MRAICRPTKMSASEVAAVRRARKGDKKALEEIIRLAEPFVFYNCLKFTGKDHEEDAQDLTQETLIKVCSCLNMLENNERYLSWALTITINTCKDFLRKKKDFELFSDTDDQSALEIYEEMPDEDLKSQTVPEKKVDNEETQKMIRDIVNELPDEQRIAVTLTYYDFLTSREIAQQLNVNENTVKYRLASARRKIRRRIEEYKAEGIKLYNVAPASFLSYLSYFLSNEAKEMAGAILTELPVASLMAALSEAGVTIGMITGSTTASIVSAVGAALSGVGVFLSAAGGKIVAIIVMTALVVGATESAASLNNLLFQSKPDRVEVEESTFSDENSSMHHEESEMSYESSTNESEPDSSSQPESSSQREDSSSSESSTIESQVVYESSSTEESSENTEESSDSSTETSENSSTGNSSEATESSGNSSTESSNTSSQTASGESSRNAGSNRSQTESSNNESSGNESSNNESSNNESSSGESSRAESSTNESSANESSGNESSVGESSHTHTYEETNRVVGPNNPDVGYTTTITYTCSECGDTYTEEVEHLHTFYYYHETGDLQTSFPSSRYPMDPDEAWNEASALFFRYPDGDMYHYRYCTDRSCYYYYSYSLYFGSKDNRYNLNAQTNEISKGPHNIVFDSNVVRNQPTCTRDGAALIIYRCTICGRKYEVIYNILRHYGHDYQDYTRSVGADGKITIDCTCARCGLHHIYVEQSRETDADGNTTVNFQCSICQETYSETFAAGEVIAVGSASYLSADRLFIVPERFRLTA